MDNRSKHTIDEIFSQGLEGARAPVPDDIWGSISAEMENDRLRKKVFWARFVAAASVLLLIGMGTLWLTSQRGDNAGGQDAAVIAQAASGAFDSESLVSLLRSGSTGEVACEQPCEGDFVPGGSVTANEQRIAAGTHGNRSVSTVQTMFRAGGEMLKEEILQKRALVKLASQRIQSVHSLVQVPVERLDREPLLTPVAIKDPVSLEELGISTMAAVLADNIVDPSTRGLEMSVPGTSDEDEPRFASNDNRWAVGAMAGPDMSFSQQAPVANSTLMRGSSRSTLLDDPLNAPRKNSTPSTTVSTGFQVNYSVTNRLDIQSGLYYGNRSATASSNVSDLGNSEVYSTQLSSDYLEVPLMVKYDVLQGEKLDYYVGSGLSGNFLLGYSAEVNSSDGSLASRKVSTEDQFLKPAQGNVLMSTGLRYKPAKMVSLNLEPGVRYGFATSSYAFSQSQPVSLTLNTGVNLHF